MSLGSATVLLASIWCIIHLLNYAVNRKGLSVLPTNQRNPGSIPHRYSIRNSHTTQVSLKALHLRISTTAWNGYHDVLAAHLARRGKYKLNWFFRWGYNLGTVVGILGMLTGLAVLFWLSASSVWNLFQMLSNRGPITIYDTLDLARRSVDNDNITPTPGIDSTSQYLRITPIIPGVTVPLGHLPLILVAVFISQVIHELGHALAAARESLPMINAGASFTVCIPAAFVTFPNAGMKALTSQARSRIISAGAFHNLVFWCILVLVGRVGIINLASSISGYRDITDVGRVVVNVNEDSPLYLHIAPGAIISKLDDTPLGSANASNDLWETYLTGANQGAQMGWCFDERDLKETSACCNPSVAQGSSLSCFTSIDDSDQGCIDPIPLLTKSDENRRRCSSVSECSSISTCVVPHKQSQLLRMTVRPSLYAVDQDVVVLWSGSPKEVWEEVQVGIWLPRAWVLPLWLPTLLGTFWEYLKMATISLYFFNLLPLPYLDGEELLRSIIDLLFEDKQEPFIYDVEALEREEAPEDTRSHRRRKDRLIRYVTFVATGAFVCCILLGLVNSIL
ncbi:hypothetical protein B0H34DRAFT_783787 [Crassisporium funariophilum]|nr:hypothetical protein B0H34DRAFT_783787 [Crassisporium funariophilum]